MVTVKFNSVDEFCDELRKEQGNIERRIVRLTNSYIQSRLSPNIWYLNVTATFLVAPYPGGLPAPIAGPHIVRLDRYCGDIWKIASQDKPVLERAKAASQQIEETCKELAYEVRAGVYEETKEKNL